MKNNTIYLGLFSQPQVDSIVIYSLRYNHQKRNQTILVQLSWILLQK